MGFIRKLPHHLVASFRATLEEVRESDLLVHVIDASHPGWEEQRLVVDEVLADLGVQEKPVVHAFNKVDRLAPEALEGLRARIGNLLPGAVFVSAVTPGGLEPLRGALRAAAERERPVVELRLPAGDGKRLAEIHRAGEVIETRHDEATGELVVRARVSVEAASRLRERSR